MKIIERTQDLETGEITDIERDATPQEIAEAQDAQKKAEIQIAEIIETETKRAALLEKLGITKEEAKLLLA